MLVLSWSQLVSWVICKVKQVPKFKSINDSQVNSVGKQIHLNINRNIAHALKQKTSATSNICSNTTSIQKDKREALTKILKGSIPCPNRQHPWGLVRLNHPPSLSGRESAECRIASRYNHYRTARLILRVLNLARTRNNYNKLIAIIYLLVIQGCEAPDVKPYFVNFRSLLFLFIHLLVKTIKSLLSGGGSPSSIFPSFSFQALFRLLPLPLSII